MDINSKSNLLDEPVEPFQCDDNILVSQLWDLDNMQYCGRAR